MPCKAILFCLIILLGCSFSLTARSVSDGNPTRDSASGSSITPLFTLDTVNPLLTVITPNGGETLYFNQQKDIQWSAVDSHFLSAPIVIEFSADNGSTFSSLTGNQNNTGSYLWTIPGTAVPQAKIRISATDSFGNAGSDLSDAAFSLAGVSISVTPLFTLDTVAPTVDLLAPNGGESWYIGETHDLLWTAADSHLAALPVKLEYKKLSNGIWNTIQTDLANTGTYGWLMPSVTSTATLVRLSVQDAYGNTANDVSASPFSIGYVPPEAPANVTVEIANSRDAIISWDAVTQTILGTPILPDAYLVLYNQTSDAANEAAYYFLEEVAAAGSITHHNVARHAAHMYYRVVAVKYYDGRGAVLAGLPRRANKSASDIDVNATADIDINATPISWLELKRRLAD